jgi:hypothetical protein
MSGTCWSTSLPGSTVKFGSSCPASPWRCASTHEACHSRRIRSLLIAACDSETHCVTYCSNTRRCVGWLLVFSNVMPAAPKPLAGTVSP